ncbi:PLAT/LH2 domain-containing protein [Streptomyces roseochromogenus]|nr:PLAT/LH2 domain-containing protein [Streptomyces roseochromogenus]
MTVKVIRAKGSDVCPSGSYALYEHPNCNGSVEGRVVIADESIAKNFGEIGDRGFSDTATCVVNKTKRTLELFQHPDLKGECLKVPPGGPYDLRELKNERGACLNDDVSSTRIGDVPSQGLINQFRNSGYQVFGGKVDKETGNAEGASGMFGAFANVGYVATGGKIAGKDQQAEQVAAAEKAAAAKAAAREVLYEVRIITAKDDWAGTDADVFCQFARGDRKSGWTKLDKPNYNDFEKGDDDTYSVYAPGDFGDPKHIEFKVENKDDMWLLQWVTVKPWGHGSRGPVWHCPLLNDTKVWMHTKNLAPGEGAGGLTVGAQVSLFLAPGESAVKGEPNPDAERYGRAVVGAWKHPG